MFNFYVTNFVFSLGNLFNEDHYYDRAFASAVWHLDAHHPCSEDKPCPHMKDLVFLFIDKRNDCVPPLDISSNAWMPFRVFKCSFMWDLAQVHFHFYMIIINYKSNNFILMILMFKKSF